MELIRGRGLGMRDTTCSPSICVRWNCDKCTFDYTQSGKPYLEMFLPPFVAETIALKMENEAGTSAISITPHKSHIFENVMKVYSSLTKYLEHSYVVLTGGYVPFVEGLTSEYLDIDFFVLADKPGVVRDWINNKWTDLIGDWKFQSNFFECDSYPWNGDIFRVYYLDVTTPRKREKLLINIILSTKPPTCLDWVSAVKTVTNKFDIGVCCAAIMPDGRNIIRFRTPSYRNPSRSITLWRSDKYRQRMICYGSPDKLVVLAWQKILELSQHMPPAASWNDRERSPNKSTFPCLPPCSIHTEA